MIRPDAQQATRPIDPAALAEVAFASASEASQLSRSLAWSAPEDLGIDLDDPAQRRFGDYELLELLGRGGMGAVYRALQHGLDREVAIKFLAAGPWASNEFVERFRREAKAAARMQHPNIVEIYDTGERDGLYWFSMRLVDGPTLAQRLRERGPPSPREAASLLRTVAEAIDYAHRLGVLHLDLKPGNVLLGPNDEPLVADFGLARRIDEGPRGDAEDIAGTPSYMAPEQALAKSHPIGPAADIYGLGAIGYELLSGHPPFLGGTPRSTLEQVVKDEPRPLRVLNRGVPADLAAICARCLRKEPAGRYASARELAEDLGRFLDGRAVSVRPLGAMQRLWRWTRREPRLAAMFGLVLISLTIGIVATASEWRRAEAALVLAEQRALRNTQLASLLAVVYPDHDDPGVEETPETRKAREKVGEAVQKRIVGWLQRELPGDDTAQGEILVAFMQALDAADNPGAAYELLLPVVEELGGEFRARVAQARVARGTARDLALAAMLLASDGGANDRQRDESGQDWRPLLLRALELAPQDLDVLAVATYYCDDSPICREADPERRLAEAEPDNAANWAIAMRWHQDEPSVLRDLLRRAAQASRYDDHWLRMTRLGSEALLDGGVPMPQVLLRPATLLAGDQSPERQVGYLQTWTMPIPVVNGPVRACDPQQADLSAPGLRDDCLRLAELAFRQGPGLISRLLGTVTLRRLLPGTPMADEARELRRQYLYLYGSLDRLTAEQQRRARVELVAAEALEWGEFEANKRSLDRAGIPRDPPPGWEPDDPLRMMLPEEREAYRAQQAAAQGQ